MAVFCPNNGNTYGSLQLWMDAVRDVDLGSPAEAIVKDSESFNQRLNIVGSWPRGLKIQASKAFNGVYDTQAVTTLTFQGDESIVFSLASGTALERKPVELTGFIFKHRGEGPRLTDNILNLDLNIHENFFESIGTEYDTEWVGSSNINIITHEETVDITVADNICYGSAREGIKIYNNLPNNALSNVHVNNNIVYNASSERDGFAGIKVFGGCRADINNNISLTKFKQTSKGFEYLDATLATKTGNATDSALEDIEITNEDDLFVSRATMNFQIKPDSPYLIANPNLGSFVQTVIGKGTSYPAQISFTDFNLINTTHVIGKLNPYNVNLIIGGEGEVEGYSRQASFMDGDVILADHGNLEFDQLARAFHESTGHNHDGTLSGGSLVPKIGDQESGNLLEIDNLGVKGSVVSNDITMAANSDRLLVTQQAAKGYTDFKSSGPELINTVNGTTNINFIDDTNLAKLSNLPAVGSGYVPENPQDGLYYVRQDANWIELPTAEWSAIRNTPYTLAGYGITDAISTTDTAADSAKLDGQLPSYYTNIVGRLGYQPVEQGGGTGQDGSKINIGWLGSSLGLQVSNTNYGDTWPITSTNAQAIGGVAASEVYSSTNPPPPGTSIPRLTLGGHNLATFDDGYFLNSGKYSNFVDANNSNLFEGYGLYHVSTGGWKHKEAGTGGYIIGHEVTNTLDPKIRYIFSDKTTDSAQDENATLTNPMNITKNYLDHKELKESGVSLTDKYIPKSDLVTTATSTDSTKPLAASVAKELNDGKLGKLEQASDSLKLSGYPASSTASTNTVVVRNGTGDIEARFIRSTHSNDSTIPQGASMAFRNDNGSDNFVRFVDNKQSVADWMGSKTRRGTLYVSSLTSNLDVSRATHGSNPDIQTWSANGGIIRLLSGWTQGDVITIRITNPTSNGLLIENIAGGEFYDPNGQNLKGDQLKFTKPCTITVFFYTTNSCMLQIQ